MLRVGFTLVLRMLIVSLVLLLALNFPNTTQAAPLLLIVDRYDDEPTAQACTGASNDCSLRGAIIAADANPGADTITLPAGTYSLSSELLLTGDLEINGSGYGSTFIDGGGTTNLFRRTGPAATLTIRYLTFRFGQAPSGGFGSCYYQSSGYTTTMISVRFFQCHSDGRGGAIYNAGSLSLEDSILDQNSATGHISGQNSGGAIYMTSGDLTLTRTRFIENGTELSGVSGNGGAIHFGSNGTLMVVDSSFSGNQARVGGAIAAAGTVTINGTTFSGNSADFGGALYYSDSDQSLTVINSTFNGNDEGAINNAGEAYIYNSTLANNTTDPTLINSGSLTIQHSILNRTDGSNCVTSMTSAGYNIENTNGCGLVGPGDMVNTDPLLGTFDWHGGPTQTISLQAQSPAVDGGDPTGCRDELSVDLVVDQRGFPRPVDGDLDGNARCDIGAVERELNILFLPLVLR